MPFRVSGVVQPTSTHTKVTGMMGPNRGSCSEHPRRMRMTAQFAQIAESPSVLCEEHGEDLPYKYGSRDLG